MYLSRTTVEQFQFKVKFLHFRDGIVRFKTHTSLNCVEFSSPVFTIKSRMMPLFNRLNCIVRVAFSVKTTAERRVRRGKTGADNLFKKNVVGRRQSRFDVKLSRTTDVNDAPEKPSDRQKSRGVDR
jgi:hypothetical protein